MKAIDIPVGARVRDVMPGKPLKNCPVGTVVANQLRFGDEVLVVEWDSSLKITPHNVNDVEVISDSQLETDFVSLSAQIKQKMLTAAHAIQDAQKMAILNGYELHGYDLAAAIDPLMTIMDEVGWRTSSLVC